MNNILIFGTNIEIVEETKSSRSKTFDIKVLGEANLILGIKVEKSVSRIYS